MVKENGIDQEELSHILRLTSWTAEQAAQVLEAQRKSGCSQAQYAAQRGFSVGRLYNWKSKLRAKLRTAPRPADSEKESERESETEPERESETVSETESETESEKVSETESEKESARGVGGQDFGLNLQRPGERFMHDYLVRAIRGSEAMWHLFSFRRHGAVLLCVVQWLHKVGKTNSYSLVTLELEERALRWSKFPTVEAAAQAMEACGAASVRQRSSSSTPLLVPVQVRDSSAEGQAALQGRCVDEPSVCMTLCLPSGVRIQMTETTPKRLLRTVLRAVTGVPC